MTNDYGGTAAALKSILGLDVTPVALSFVDQAPAGVTLAGSGAPSACSFWRDAERGVFYAPAVAHFNCPIGAMVLGFDLPADAQQSLGAVVEKMIGCGYLGEDEPGLLPVVGRRSSGIVYGPLSEMPCKPDVVLAWLTARQAMVYAEAVRSAGLAGNGAVTTFGRPACSAVPAAMDSVNPTLSLGCAGMRTFTGIGEDRMLAVIPADALAPLLDSLRRIASANATMQLHYDAAAAQFGAAAAAAAEPVVA